jgi:tRNA-dihydrouridine synthase B
MSVNKASARPLPFTIDRSHPILAPMDGVSDAPFRILAREFGAGILYTEFINGIDIVSGNQLARFKMTFSDFERPIGIQIFDDQPARLLQAAKIVERECRPDFIDLNLACPNQRVVSRGAGAALLEKPDVVREMLQALTRELGIPVSAKFRLGFSGQHMNYLEIAKIAEECGASHMAVHGRTAEQGMQGQVDLDAIRQIKENAGIPVIGNGDISHPEDIQKMLALTRCDAVMIGRGAVGNPWIFRHQSREDIPLSEIVQTVLHHLELTLSHYGEQKGLLVFRKHFKQYARAFDLPKPELDRLLTLGDAAEFAAVVRSIA